MLKYGTCVWGLQIICTQQAGGHKRKRFDFFFQDGTSFDNPSPDTFKVEPQIDDVNLSDNMISNGTDQSQQSSLPVDLSTSDQCQETVDTFMKLVGGGDDNVFDNNTVTVMQQPLGQQQSVSGSQIGSPNVATSAADFFNGFEMMQPAEHKLFPQTSSAIGPKRRGRPPGSGWKMQQRELMGGMSLCIVFL